MRQQPLLNDLVPVSLLTIKVLVLVPGDDQSWQPGLSDYTVHIALGSEMAKIKVVLFQKSLFNTVSYVLPAAAGEAEPTEL